MTRTVIIDTDPGLDDAIAILFALGCGRFEVLGISTLSGNIGIERTTANAAGLLAVMDRSDLPVARGAAHPLRRAGIDEAGIHGDDGMGGVTLPAPTQVPHPDAVAWMADELLRAPAGTVDVLALGPLTNIAGLIADHPEAARRIGRLVAMGGAIDEPGNVGTRSEFNFAADPEAVALVLESGVSTTIIPLDVTRRVRADAAYIEALRGTRHGDLAADLIAAYFGAGKASRPLHDPCVMLYALAPEFFGVETRPLAVELDDNTEAGALIRSANGRTVDVALRIDAPAALALLRTGFV